MKRGSRGLQERTFFPIRDEHEDYDRENIKKYITTLKRGKENKGATFFTQEGKKGEIKGMFIVVMEKVDEQKAKDKGYVKK